MGQIEPENKNQNRQVDNSGNFQVEEKDVYVFSGIKGPDGIGPLSGENTSLSLGRYQGGSGSRMAVLLTDPTSDWLGLAHGLKSRGIPFSVTSDYREAMNHRVILAYPMISGRYMTPEVMKALSVHAQNGGTLVATQPLSRSMESLLGYTEAIPSRQHRLVRLKPGSLERKLEDPREETLSISGSLPEEMQGSHSFLFPQGEVMAQFEDGSAAVIRRTFGRGAAYGVGMDIGHWLLNGYNSRAESSARSYVNEYEPSLDVLLQWLKEIYRSGEEDSVVLGSVPGGRSLAVLMTHDVDFGPSVINSVAYADYEKSMGIKATYFIQTKYIRDYYDEIFFNEKYVPYLKELLDRGMEVGSHTVSHTKLLAYLPVGTGTESYPSYRPYISGLYAVHNATVLGEVRVSKFLLEKIGGQPVVSFRAGHLGNPRVLPQVLENSGYLYSSNVTANSALTHLPFQLTYSRDHTSEVNIYEFPITIEDEADPPMDARLDKAIALGNKISRYGGAMIVLIHPNVLGPKLAFEKGLVERFRNSAWFGSLKEYGDWWSARDRVTVDVQRQGEARVVKLHMEKPIAELPIEVPLGWTLEKGDGKQAGNVVLISASAGETELMFRVR